MQAWVVDHVAATADGPLRRIERALPEPGHGRVRVRIRFPGSAA